MRTELFTPFAVPLLGQEIAALDPRTLLHMYGAVGHSRLGCPILRGCGYWWLMMIQGYARRWQLRFGGWVTRWNWPPTA